MNVHSGESEVLILSCTGISPQPVSLGAGDSSNLGKLKNVDAQAEVTPRFHFIAPEASALALASRSIAVNQKLRQVSGE